MSNTAVVKRSLTQHFSPVPGFIGEFGWICGYSADVKFVDMASERFMGQIAARRARSGCLRLGLLLDPGNPQLPVTEVPGAMHFPVRDGKLPFRLLHAKVAVLGFRSLEEPERFQLRLLVSTGNWTRATLEDNLDLIWRVDVDSDDLDLANAEMKRRCADLVGAWDMMVWLRRFFDTSLLTAVPEGLADTETSLALSRFENWLSEVRKRAGGSPRFIDNRQMGLLANLQSKLEIAERSSARNYLAMGSGFYEEGTSGQLPSVPRSIIESLEKSGLLTKTAEVDIYVNPGACQAIADGIGQIAAKGWTVRPPPAEHRNRFMHAKFLFSARAMDSSDRCASAWSYLGSGNLTGPGFIQPASANGGNLEAGVFQEHTDLYWSGRQVEPLQVVGNLLPIHEEEKLSAVSALGRGEGMSPREPQFVALPFTFFLWASAPIDGGWLYTASKSSVAFQVHDRHAVVRPGDANGRIRWHGQRPQQVTLTWERSGRACQAQIPVIDEFGRVAGGAVSDLGLEEAVWELEGFPAPTDVEDDDVDDDDTAAPPVDLHDEASYPNAPMPGNGRYPIRQMMKLIEQIAEKQCSMAQVDWAAWCHRLEQVLARVRSSESLAEFLKLRINPLSALYQPAFRPSYAEEATSDEGERYEAALQRIEQAWEVIGLEPLRECA